jgi:hypothetical protein
MANPRQAHPKLAQKVQPHQPNGGGQCTMKAHQQGAGRGRVLCGYGRGRARGSCCSAPPHEAFYFFFFFFKKKNLINILNQ